jgi:hypothetical protein
MRVMTNLNDEIKFCVSGIDKAGHYAGKGEARTAA